MTNPRPLFISHSSDENQDQADLLEAISTRFGSEFELLLDQDLLIAGDEWRGELHTWMAMCQAAIVILSPGVVARPEWVLKELTILTWRRSLDPRFILIPVLLPSVRASDFANGLFAPLLVSEIQMAKGATAAVLAEIDKRLDPLRQREPTHLTNLIDNIAGKLAPLSANRCRQAGLDLDGEPLNWDARLSAHERLARRMVHADFTKLTQVLANVSPLITAPAACDIMDWLFAFWIAPEAVAPIPDVVRGPAPARALALNGTNPRTGSLYVRRAFCNYPPGSIEATINDDGGELTVESIEKQLRTHFQSKSLGLRNATEAMVKTYVLKMGEDVAGKPPFFVIFPRALPWADLSLLKKKYPRFTFVLTTGEKLPAEDYYPAGSVRLLRPELEPDREMFFHVQYIETELQIRPTPI